MARYILMATGNLLLGYGRRSIGDITFYRSGGQQRSRARNRKPANPRSEKQSIQRMVLATTAKMAAAFEPIVNHSWEGVAVGQASVQHFRSLAMNTLRTAAIKIINDPSEQTPFGQYAIKGAPIVGYVEGIRISSGSLGINGIIARGNDTIRYVLGEALSTSAITTQEQYVAELRKMSLQPGDQLTFVVQSVNLNLPVATFAMDGSTTANFAERVQFCRVVFVPELPENFTGTIIVNGAFNPALIQEQQGILPSVAAAGTAPEAFLDFDFGDALDVDYDIEAAGIIRSQKQLNGSYKYSNTWMKDFNTLDGNNADLVYLSYMDGVGEVNVGDQLYLRHAVASPFGMGE